MWNIEYGLSNYSYKVVGLICLNIDVLQLTIQIVEFHYLTHKEIAITM